MSTSDTDRLQHFHFEEAAVRGEIVRLEGSLAEVLGQHFYPAPAAALLGEALAASVLLSGTLKFSGTLSLQAKSGGAVQLLFAECGHDRRIRGYARVAESALGEGLVALLGGGTLAITITPDRGQRYQGVVPLDAPRLGDCLEHYFAQSEQLPTLIRLASDGTRAAGLLLQVLPERSAGQPGAAGQWEHLRQLAATVREAELLAEPFEPLLWKLFHEDGVRVQPPAPVAFGCRCSPERASATLQSIGETEARAALAEQDPIRVQCEFCQQEYRFDATALDRLFGTAGSAGTADTRH